MSGFERWVGDGQPPVPSPLWGGLSITSLPGGLLSQTITGNIASLTLPSPADSRLVYSALDLTIVSVKFACGD